MVFTLWSLLAALLVIIDSVLNIIVCLFICLIFIYFVLSSIILRECTFNYFYLYSIA